MTNAEAERIVERIRKSGQYEYVRQSYEYKFTPWKMPEEQDEAYAAERSWIKQAFMSEPMVGEGEEHDRYPRFISRYMGRPAREHTPVYYENANGSRVYGWVNEQIPKQRTTSELQAGDTTELDSFLAGFSTK